MISQWKEQVIILWPDHGPVVAVFGQYHGACMLKTNCVVFEKECAHCSRALFYMMFNLFSFIMCMGAQVAQ